MNELTVKDDFLIQLKELETMQSVCSKLLQTKHYAQIGEAGLHAIVSRAKSLGIHPFQALNGGFHCINGKVGMSTEMMNALIRKHGHSVTKDPSSNEEKVILHGKRADSGDTWTCSFSKNDAIAAGLWNTATWKKYPSIMLFNRCMSMLFRQLFPDLSLGAGYVKDELEEIEKVGDYKNLPLAQCDIKNISTTQDIVDQFPDTKKMIGNNPKANNDQFVSINEMIGNSPESNVDHIEEPLKMIQKLMTTPRDWKELEDLINQCTPKYQTQITNRLLDLGIDSNDKMDMDTFIKVRKACIENIKKQEGKS